MSKLPTISIVTCMYNCDLTVFRKHLQAIKIQRYPKKFIEHIMMDGGSKNNIITMAKSFGCTVYERPDLLFRTQERMSLGISYAKHNFVLILEPDNILIGNDWLEKMTKPFIKHKEIFCTYSAYNGYTKGMPATTRYCALLGTPDPTLYYLQKTEKIPLTQMSYDKGEILSETKDYFIVRFTKETLPTLGDNGNMFLKSALQKVNKNSSGFVHTDAVFQLLSLGYDTVGVVKNKIIHIANPTIFSLVKQRIAIKEIWTNKKGKQRVYHVFSWKSKQDIFKIALYIIFSLTAIVPLLVSIRGYLKIRDPAWFLHPVLCFLMVMGYGISEIKWFIKNRIS